MVEETPTDKAGEPKPASSGKAILAVLGSVLGSAASLKWIRSLLHNVGGRKVAVFGAGIYAILEVVKSGALQGWPLAGAILGISFLGGVAILGIAWEDRSKNGGHNA